MVLHIHGSYSQHDSNLEQSSVMHVHVSFDGNLPIFASSYNLTFL